jgi:hypothetical protein
MPRRKIRGEAPPGIQYEVCDDELRMLVSDGLVNLLETYHKLGEPIIVVRNASRVSWSTFRIQLLLEGLRRHASGIVTEIRRTSAAAGTISRLPVGVTPSCVARITL